MRFLIVGCGRAGSRLAKVLHTNGHRVTVVDNDPAALARLAGSAAVTTVLGVGVDREALLQAGIENVDGLAAATGVDEVNVVVARLARHFFHVPRVVARVYDPRKADIYRRLGIVTVSPLAWGVERMAEALVHTGMAPLLSMGSGDVNLVALEATPQLAGRTVQVLNVPREIQVTALARDGHTFLPGPETVLQAGDTVYITLLARAEGRLGALVGE
jgi:trk system potassium uptake protein TrkA